MFMSRLSLFWLSAHESCTQELADPRSYCFGHVWVCGHDWSGGGWAPHQAVLGIRAELAFLFFSVPQTPPLTLPFICSVFSLSPPIRMFLHSTVPVCNNVQTRCHPPRIERRCSYQTSILYTPSYTLLVFFFPSLSTLPGRVTSLPLSSLTPLLWPWPCPPWVIYHGPEGEPPGLQAPVSPCNRLFVAPSKQVSDQQKSIKAWWAFLSQLGSGHWAALLAAPSALCVAAVRWHRSSQD